MGLRFISSKNDLELLVGSDIKLFLEISVDGISMDIVDFDILFKIGEKSLTVNKSSLIKVDSTHYICCIKGENTDCGTLVAEILLKIPDKDFSDGYYVEKRRIITEYTLSK